MKKGHTCCDCRSIIGLYHQEPAKSDGLNPIYIDAVPDAALNFSQLNSADFLSP